jgi:hypothetical protein
LDSDRKGERDESSTRRENDYQTDVIVGGTGRDQIHRLGGDGFICCERSRDILTGGSGGDGIDTARADCDTVSNVP